MNIRGEKRCGSFQKQTTPRGKPSSPSGHLDVDCVKADSLSDSDRLISAADTPASDPTTLGPVQRSSSVGKPVFPKTLTKVASFQQQEGSERRVRVAVVAAELCRLARALRCAAPRRPLLLRPPPFLLRIAIEEE